MRWYFGLVLILFITHGKVFRSLVGANIPGLLDPKCVIAPDGCPNENVTFWLYTPTIRDAPIQLDPLGLQRRDFKLRLPVKILIHGYTGYRDFAPNSYIRPVLLRLEDVYVISVDYGPLVPEPCYITSVANVPLVSQCLAQLINNLVSRDLVANEDVHVIGFSLGAQVAGQTANYVDKRLKRITGLDPAKPLFTTVSTDRRLDASDADFVDVIHTDVLARGMLRPMGHADFYPNIERGFQPGCEREESPSSCSHERAPQYYAESIVNCTGFWSYSCPIWPWKPACFTRSNDALMGYFVDESARGTFLLQTESEPPFALGRYNDKWSADIEKPDITDY